MNHAGLYIHIPFCRSRCSYCDFATGMYQTALAERYVAAVGAEITAWPESETSIPVDTIYFGGGTPSLLSLPQLDAVMQALHRRFVVSSSAEMTLEINPGDGGTTAAARLEHLRGLRRLGINRASFGAQTFDDDDLRQLGRTHSAADLERTFVELREAGFANINFDLIAGLPGQTLAGWSRNLDRSLELEPEHLSLYLLEVHESTPLGDQIRRGQRPKPDEDLAAEMYQLLIERMCSAGYEHYEISNFCRPGYESRHNSKYWTGAPVYGFGCSAHSYDGAAKRWANERDTLAYVRALERHQSAIVEQTELSKSERQAEAIFLGLRLMGGISVAGFREHFGVDFRADYQAELAHLREAGLLELDGDRLKLTRSGAVLSNEVFVEFV